MEDILEMFSMDPDCPEDVCFMEDEDVLVVEVGGGPPAPGGRGGRVRVLLPEVTLSAVTEFLQLVSLSVDLTIMRSTRCCLCCSLISLVTGFIKLLPYLELGREVLTGRALRGLGGGILTWTSSGK